MKLTLKPGLLVLAACDSGVQHLNLGDEPLGLVMAALWGGATSVVGNFWAVTVESAKTFIRGFVPRMTTCVSTRLPQPSTVIDHFDIAGSLREVVLRKPDAPGSTLLDWGCFALHGSPFGRLVTPHRCGDCAFCRRTKQPDDV